MYKVYRVEHNDTGVGPYWFGYMGLCDRHNRCKFHPTSRNLTIRIPQYKHHMDYYAFTGSNDSIRCGFDSMSKLGNWFRGFRGELRSRGFIITVYTLDPIYTATDGRQVIFDMSKALLIEKRDVGV